MDILGQIMAERREAVEEARQRISVDALKRQAEGRTHHSLTEKLCSGSGPHIIAEVKKASPSAGLLREDYAPAEIAAGFEAAGAVGVSVLTEPLHFMGSADHLRAVREAVDLPVLRKDFICDPYQVYEAAAWGADVILLIVAALKPEDLRELHEIARSCGLEVLVESHSADELDLALDLDEALVGVNNRNLKTLKIDLATSEALASRIASSRISISESGISSRSDIEILSKRGYNGFLIGESLVKRKDSAGKLRDLLA